MSDLPSRGISPNFDASPDLALKTNACGGPSSLLRSALSASPSATAVQIKLENKIIATPTGIRKEIILKLFLVQWEFGGGKQIQTDKRYAKEISPHINVCLRAAIASPLLGLA